MRTRRCPGDAHRRHRPRPPRRPRPSSTPAPPTHRSGCIPDGLGRRRFAGGLAASRPALASRGWWLATRHAGSGSGRSPAGGWRCPSLLYPLSALQVWVLGRRAASVHPLTALLFPIAVGAFVVIFVRSLFAVVFGRQVDLEGPHRRRPLTAACWPLGCHTLVRPECDRTALLHLV